MTFDPRAFAQELESAARNAHWLVHQLSPTASGPRPWFEREASPGAPSVYLSSGIHGDEISGPPALLQLLLRPEVFDDFRVVMFPLLNPDGLALDSRNNRNGIDLNRDYRDPKTEEIQSHVQVLQTLGRFHAALMLHEDFEGVGAYLYELNDSLKPSLGTEIVAAMGRHVPIDQRPEIEEVIALQGVLRRSDLIAKHGPIEELPEWPEAIYLSVNHTQVSFTTETPKPFPLADRVAAQVAAMETLLAELKSALLPAL